jgi:glycosyltransferase involved in cell wall biosynthesis
MKIGLYTLDMPPSLGGGYVLRDDVVRFATQLRGRHSFELVAIPPEDPPPPPPPPPPPRSWLERQKDWIWPPLPVPPPPPPPPGRTAHQRFADEVKKRGFDLLWFNHFDPIYVGVPFVVNIFDLQHRLQPWFPEVSNDGQWESREAVWKEASQRAAFITVGSQEAKEQLSHFYGVPLANIRVLPFPTPQKALDIARGAVAAPPRVDVRAKYGIRNDFLFYPAQFWSHKNHVNLFLALKLLRQKGREISLVLTGADHGNGAHLQATSQSLGLADLVHFCGFVPYEDILSFYREARALSYVSFFGPENLPPLEAMALECSVILSDIPGVRTLHGDGPVCVDPRDPASIAAGIEFVLDHEEQMRSRLPASKTIALRNDCQNYLETFQGMLDDFMTYRQCWP